jgi:16S rRNA (guanine966-N2)-methyltransferase
VIGGEFRGRRLSAPVTPSVRPTSDRAREAIFDMLFSLGGVDGLQVADLFSGTGALGIEALSRGAASVTFVDRDPASLDLIRQNLASVGLPDAERDGDATIVRAEVESWLGSTVSRYDLVLADPPYAYDGWENLIRRLPGDLVVLESGAELPEVDGWGVLKFKRYGGTIVTVARPEPVSQKGAS